MNTRTLLMPALLFFCWIGASSQEMQDWKTYYEKSGYLETPRYDETVEYCKRLASASPWAEFQSFGTSPQGELGNERPLVTTAIGADDARSLVGERGGDGAADARSRSRDDRDLPPQSIHGRGA